VELDQNYNLSLAEQLMEMFKCQVTEQKKPNETMTYDKKENQLQRKIMKKN